MKGNKESNVLCNLSVISTLPPTLPRFVKVYELAKYTFNENAGGFIGQFERRTDSHYQHSTTHIVHCVCLHAVTIHTRYLDATPTPQPLSRNDVLLHCSHQLHQFVVKVTCLLRSHDGSSITENYPAGSYFQT